MNKKGNRLVKGLGFFSIVIGLLFVVLVFALKKSLMIAEIGKLFNYAIEFFFKREWANKVLTANLIIVCAVVVAIVWMIVCVKKKKLANGLVGSMGVLGGTSSLLLMYRYRNSLVANAKLTPVLGNIILVCLVLFFVLMVVDALVALATLHCEYPCCKKDESKLAKVANVVFGVFAVVAILCFVAAFTLRFEGVMKRAPKFYHFVLDLLNVSKWDASNITTNFSAVVVVLCAAFWFVFSVAKKRSLRGPLSLVITTGMALAAICYADTFAYYADNGTKALNLVINLFNVLFALSIVSTVVSICDDCLHAPVGNKKLDAVSILLVDNGEKPAAEPAPVEVTNEESDLVEVVDENNNKLVISRRLFINKLCLASDELKANYNVIKNAIMKYNKVHSRISASYESFRKGRKLLVRFNILGKTLRVYLALDPNEYPVTVYHQRNEGDKRKYQDVPMMLRVRSPRSVRNAVKLIDELMEKEGIALAKVYEEVDYARTAKFDDTPVAPKPAPVVKEEVLEETPVVEEVNEEAEVLNEEAPVADGDLIEVIDENNKKLIINKRLYTNKLCLANDDLKANYNVIKNAIMKYNKVRSRISSNYESFRKGRKLLVRFNILGKTLRVYLALDPNEYPVTVYHQRNEGDKRKYQDVPMMLRVRSPRSVRNAVKLIDELMEKEGIALAKVYEEVDYAKEFKYDSHAILVKDGFGKLVREEIDEAHTDDLTDAEAMKVVVNKEVVETSDKSVKFDGKVNKSIVNVDQINQVFDHNEYVTLEKLKEHGLVSKKTNYVKVLSRGVINKPMTIEANEFSLKAVKMIVLTGGSVVKLVSK